MIWSNEWSDVEDSILFKRILVSAQDKHPIRPNLSCAGSKPGVSSKYLSYGGKAGEAFFEKRK